MEREYRMSAARAEELQEELNYLKTTRSDEVAEQIKVARGFGDLSENSEYDEAKNEQGKLYSRIAELEEILLHAVIVDGRISEDALRKCGRNRAWVEKHLKEQRIKQDEVFLLTVNDGGTSHLVPREAHR